LYEEGVCIVEDFFGDTTDSPNNDPHYPKPLFACTDAQSEFITKKGVSRETIFDGVLRSNQTCGYHTHFDEEKKINRNKLTGPGPRQQLKPCKVIVPSIKQRDPTRLLQPEHPGITIIYLPLLCAR
jgi:hypothetical protein